MRSTMKTLLGLALATTLALTNVACNDEGDDIPQAPQIMPHVNPVNACEVWMGNEDFPAQQWNFDLLLYNLGREQLEIESFEVRHDRRCGFSGTGYGVRMFDENPDDDFAATARLHDAAIMRLQYVPPGEGVDEAEIVIHSNAENFPDLSIYVCAAGTPNTTLSCNIRVDPDCTASGAACRRDDDCPTESEQCIYEDFDSPDGTCQCRPCGLPPEEDWADCEED